MKKAEKDRNVQKGRGIDKYKAKASGDWKGNSIQI